MAVVWRGLLSSNNNVNGESKPNCKIVHIFCRSDNDSKCEHRHPELGAKGKLPSSLLWSVMQERRARNQVTPRKTFRPPHHYSEVITMQFKGITLSGTLGFSGEAKKS